MQTARLDFEPLQASDLKFMLDFHADPVQTQYLPLERPYTPEEAENYLNKRIEHWEEHSFGTFALRLKSTGVTVGYCGLEYVRETPLCRHSVWHCEGTRRPRACI